VAGRSLKPWGAAVVCGTLLAIGGVVALSRESALDDVAVVAAVDLLAARRPSVKPTIAEAPPVAEAHDERLDASGTAAVAYKQGDFTTALEQYQTAVEKNPQDAESLSNLGQVLVRVGRIDEALPYFDRAIALIPQRWAYHFNRARALALLDRWDDAIASYTEAQRLFPDDYATTFNLGLALHSKGDENGAVREYKKAIALEPNDPSFYMALGISLERLQQPREAAAAYAEYLRTATSAPDAERVKARITQLKGE
jgi:tetratricopeptide (TPR) repeat protein